MSPNDQQEPATSFLRARAKKAKAAAAASASSLAAKRTHAPNSLRASENANHGLTELAHTATQPRETQTAHKPISDPDTSAGQAISKDDTDTATPIVAKNTAPNVIMLKTDDCDAPENPSNSDRKAMMLELIEQHAPNKLAFEWFKPDLADIMSGLIRGACLVGIRGHQDRMTVFRMMGLPWTPSVSQFRAETGGMEAMADRIARAVTRREGRLLSHDTVTIDVPIEPEAAPVLAEFE